MPPIYANGHISATGDPIHFMFGSRVGFSGTAEWRYFWFEQIQDGGRRHLEKISNGHISATGRPIHFMFGYRVGFSGTADLNSNGAIVDSNKFKMAATIYLYIYCSFLYMFYCITVCVMDLEPATEIN